MTFNRYYQIMKPEDREKVLLFHHTYGIITYKNAYTNINRRTKLGKFLEKKVEGLIR